MNLQSRLARIEQRIGNDNRLARAREIQRCMSIIMHNPDANAAARTIVDYHDPRPLPNQTTPTEAEASAASIALETILAFKN